MTILPYPLTFRPEFRQYIWGGRRLGTLFQRIVPGGTVAESWEISGHLDSPTMVDSGPLKGQTLPQVLDSLGVALVGTHARTMLERHRFPLLVKLLDADKRLSLQVHPDDAYAREHESGELGKAEMWYVLYAEPGAELIHGLAPGVTRETFRQALENGSVAPLLRHVPVQPGDIVFIPTGTVHALLEGIVVAEIQQNSDATYRVYDWGRVDSDGAPRELHIDKALEVIKPGTTPAIQTPTVIRDRDGIRVERLVSCPRFDVERVRLSRGAVFGGECDGHTFEIWGTVQGTAQVEPSTGRPWPVGPVRIAAVSWILLPAALGGYRIRASEDCTLLRAFLSKPV